jgi:DNA-binding beta-propeller fold protein YncE
MFAEVVVESKPCEMNLVRKKDKQAQIMVADLSPPISVDNIQLKLKQKINIKGKSITECSFLSDGRIVFSCSHTNTISFINKEGVESFQIGKYKTGANTYDTVFIKDNNSVAVSSGKGDNRCLSIIDRESQKVMTTISMDTYIYGMAVRGKTIYYYVGSKGIKMVNLNDKSISNIIKSNMNGVYYLAISGAILYYANVNAHTVTCCDLHGTTQWKFKNERVLRAPLGVVVDNDGNVFVVGYYSDNVVVISPDGQRHRQLLSLKQGLRNPRVLDYDKSTNMLLVVNNSSTAFLFDVTG